jgi:hypothetical protein
MISRMLMLAAALLLLPGGAGAQTSDHSFSELTSVASRRGAVRDSLTNGILIGVGGGAVAGWTWVRSHCGPPGFDPECSANAGIVLYPITIGIGAGIGALVDAAIHKTVFVSRNQRTQLTVSPLIGRDARGVRASFRF